MVHHNPKYKAISHQTDMLLQLIQLMSKSEKRSLRLHVNKDGKNNEKLYTKIFDYIDKTKVYDEDDLVKKHPEIKKHQIPNLKASLLKQILHVLKHLEKNRSIDLQIRELTDYAHLLSSKGLTKASLDYLEKAKKLAQKFDKKALLFHVVDLERNIETQFITGNSTQKAIELDDVSDKLMKQISIQNALSNLSLMLYGMYLKFGIIKNEEDFKTVNQFFNANLPATPIDESGFYIKIYYYQSHVWYYHMIQDFVQYYKFAQKWIDTYEANPDILAEDKITYLKGWHNAMNALYMADKPNRFTKKYALFTDIGTVLLETMNDAEIAMYQQFKYIHLLNKIFITADYQNAVSQISNLELILRDNIYAWDQNRMLVFYYKIACVYFGNAQYDKALFYLETIHALSRPGFREDIQSFARILTLIAHFELKNETVVGYQIKSVYRFLHKMSDLKYVQKEILEFLKKTPYIGPLALKKEFILLKQSLQNVQNNHYERRPFLYLDIISWLDSKILDKPIADIIKQKRKNK